MALSGLGRLQMVDTAMRPRAAMLLQDVASAPWGTPPSTHSPEAATTYVLSWKRTKFLMLWKTPFPSSTALLPREISVV